MVGVQRTLTWARVAAIPFGMFQIATFYLPYPPGTLWIAWSAMAVLSLVTPTVFVGAARATTLTAARRWALVGLAGDIVVVMMLVTAHTFDPETAVWALLYLVLIEGAIVFELRGGLAVLGVITVLYTLREVYGAAVWDVPFLPQSITFRMGIGAIMAVATGLTARRLVKERDQLQVAKRTLDRRGAALRDANRALEAARKSQLEFISVTNHELRTPLTAIKGFSRTLMSRWDEMDDAGKRAAISAIDRQSVKLSELVEDVLTVSAMHTGDLPLSSRKLHLATWFDEAASLAEADDIVIDCPEDLWVKADSTRLVQVLGNLLSNAHKYGRPPILLTGRVGRTPDRVVITVADHGPGIPPDFQSRMYDEFTQASVGDSRTADGYGLGLAIVRYLVGVLDGTIQYRSAYPAGGAVFEIDLPAGDLTPDASRRVGEVSVLIDDGMTPATADARTASARQP